MARSLVVKPEEEVTAGPLLWGFLVFAALWLTLGAVAAGTAEADAAQPAAASVTVH